MRSPFAWLSTAAALVLGAVASPALAHNDGQSSDEKHVYRATGTSGNYYGDPYSAAVYGCSQKSNPIYVSHQFNQVTRRWSMTCRNSAATVITDYDFPDTGNEFHCTLDTAKSATSGIATCTADSSCAASLIFYHSWNASSAPLGFNVPNDSNLPEPWLSHRGCAFERVSASTNGSCQAVQYRGTGWLSTDENGEPSAHQQGNFFVYNIPEQCNPTTGENTPWGGSGSDPSNVCANRSGDPAQIHWLRAPDSDVVPTWVCIDGCKAVPRSGETEICVGIGEGATDQNCGVPGIFPFPDEPNFGRCTAQPAVSGATGLGGTRGGSGGSGSGEGGGGGSGTNGVPGDTDGDGTCTEADGELCGDVDGVDGIADGDAQDGLDELAADAADLGQSDAQDAIEGKPDFAGGLTSWAAGGGTCAPFTLGGDYNLSIDACQGINIFREIAEWVLWVLLGWYLLGVWRRAAE